MLAVERISSLDDPRLEIYRNLRETNGQRDQRVFVAEGPTVVKRLLNSDFRIRHLLISDRNKFIDDIAVEDFRKVLFREPGHAFKA